MDLDDSLDYPHGAAEAEALPDGEAKDVSLVDLMAAIERYDVPILCISPHHGIGILGSGASGDIRQSIADSRTSLAFKNSTPDFKVCDDAHSSDWASLINELAILQYAPISKCPSIIDLVGITWEYSKGSVWPRMITPKVNGGSLDRFLLKEKVEDDVRLRIAAHVLQSVAVLHGCGVAHGDLKPLNVVVDCDEDLKKVTCQLVDLGGSAMMGQERFPLLSIPWNAPELLVNRSSVNLMSAKDLIQADLFSLGLLLVHILIPHKTLRAEELRLSKDTVEEQNLTETLSDLARESQICNESVGLLESLLPGLLHSRPEKRRLGLDQRCVQDLLDSYGLTIDDRLEPLAAPPVFAPTAKVQLDTMLDELDDSDFQLRRDVSKDVIRKSKLTGCDNCKQRYHEEIALYYQMGFGVARDTDQSSNHCAEAGISESAIVARLKALKAEYWIGGCGSSHLRTVERFGIETLLSTDLVQQYQQEGRLREAQQSIEEERDARSDVFGSLSICLTKLEGELAQIYFAQHHLTEAEELQHKVIERLRDFLGPNDGYVLTAEYLLAVTRFKRGYLLETETTFRAILDAFRANLPTQHPRITELLRGLGHLYLEQGNYDAAHKHLKEVLNLRLEALGIHHPMSLLARMDVALTLKDQRYVQKAKDIIKQISEDAAGHGDLLTRFNISMNLAAIYIELGDYDAAFLEAATLLYLVKKDFEDNDPVVLDAMERVADVHRFRGEYGAEEGLLREVMQQKASQELVRPSVLETRYKVALNLKNQNQINESLDLAHELITTLEANPGSHPLLMSAAQNLVARCLWLSGASDAAEKAYLKLYEDSCATFGSWHPITMSALTSITSFLKDMVRFHEIITILSTAFRTWKEQDIRIKEVFSLLSHLVIAYRDANQYGEAIEVCQEAIAWSTETLGECHHETLNLRSILASVMFYSGESQNAQLLWTELCRIALDTPMYPRLLMSLVDVHIQTGEIQKAMLFSNEAVATLRLQEVPESSELILAEGGLIGLKLNYTALTPRMIEEAKRNIDAKRRLYGAGHQTTIRTMTDLAVAYTDSNDLAKARAIFDELDALDIDRCLQNRLRYATYLGQKAELEFRTGQLDAAEELERSALGIRQSLLGEESPATLKSMANLATTLCAQARYEQAEELCRQVITPRSRTLGVNHTLTLDARNDLAGIMFMQRRLEEAIAELSDILRLAEELPESAAKIEYRRRQLQSAKAELDRVTNARTSEI
ncbi:hypothetical protein BJY01DRAFT_246920 [Aspergillus pseudoustus]|uniref:Protein kinase domain-containing protein n=1 Tax=Aspergillus pseudoustus TaxID=1810923 RepID=A0ABR4K4A1_9EURO